MEEVNLESLMNVTYGLYVISSKQDGEVNGMIANTVMQTSLEPPTVTVCLNKKHLTHEFIEESGVFSIAVLAKESPLKFIGNFGFYCGRDRDKFADVNYEIKKTGAPIILDHTVSYIEAEVIEQLDAKTHTVFLGKIVGADEISDQEPMTYDYYHQVKNGKTPESAPSYVKPETENKSGEDKYKCEVCGYVYDPAQGDPDNGVEAGTDFADLPHGWKCPVCGADKDQFFKVEPISDPQQEADKYKCEVCGYIYDPAQGDLEAGIEPGTRFEDLPEDWKCPLCGVGKDKFEPIAD